MKAGKIGIKFIACIMLLGLSLTTSPVHAEETLPTMATQTDLVRGEALYDSAQAMLYRSVSSGREPLTDQKIKAHHFLEEAYNLGYKKAAGALGFSYIYAPDIDQPDLNRVYRLFEEGRALKDPQAIRGLALFHREGWLSPRDDKKMVEFYEEAAALGDNQAQYLLGVFLTGLDWIFYFQIQPERSSFAAVDPNKGLYWLKTSADNGNLRAWEMLAHYYRYKEKKPKYQEFYLRMGIKKGNAHLLTRLILFYGNEEYYPVADLKSEDRGRLKKCLDDLYDKVDKNFDKPIPNLDELCPRKLPSPLE